MAKVLLIEGPVGAGKSSYSDSLSRERGIPHINLDAWMARLFGPDRPGGGNIEWYLERKERCIEQIWDVAYRVLETGSDIILELGLIQRLSREAMVRRIEESGHEVLVYVLDAPRDTRRERVLSRNAEKGDTFSMEVPEALFEVASDMWEAPDDIESEFYEVSFVSQAEVDRVFKLKKG